MAPEKLFLISKLDFTSTGEIQQRVHRSGSLPVVRLHGKLSLRCPEIRCGLVRIRLLYESQTAPNWLERVEALGLSHPRRGTGIVCVPGSAALPKQLPHNIDACPRPAQSHRTCTVAADTPACTSCDPAAFHILPPEYISIERCPLHPSTPRSATPLAGDGDDPAPPYVLHDKFRICRRNVTSWPRSRIAACSPLDL